MNHRVWNFHLLRGAVTPRCEEEIMRQVISIALERCGGNCRKKEIAVPMVGNRGSAAFILPKVTIDSLIFPKKGASWSAAEWP
jgi:hypothetical protein